MSAVSRPTAFVLVLASVSASALAQGSGVGIPEPLLQSWSAAIAVVELHERLAADPSQDYGEVFERLPLADREAILATAPYHERQLARARARQALVEGDVQASIPHLALALDDAVARLFEASEFTPHEIREREDSARRVVTLVGASLNLGARTVSPTQANQAVRAARSLRVDEAVLVDLAFAANDEKDLLRFANESDSVGVAAQALLQLGRLSGDAGVLEEAAERIAALRADLGPDEQATAAYLALKESEALVRGSVNLASDPVRVERIEALMTTAALETDALIHPFLHAYRCSVEYGLVTRMLARVRADAVARRNQLAGRRDAAAACALTGVTI